ncbi:MAG: hypothetical protein ACRDTE_12810 [Pseudonocardiaceae bacterium]
MLAWSRAPRAGPFCVIYTDPTGSEAKAFTTVAQHPGDVPAGTLSAIERDLEVAFGKG